MGHPLIFLPLLVLLGLLVALFAALVFVNERAKDAVQYHLLALEGVGVDHMTAAWACLLRVEQLVTPWRTLRDHLIAPFWLAIALLFVPRSADKLPGWLAYWENNAGPNGDGLAVLRDGKWIDLQDIGWQPDPGERVVSYNDPQYTGKSYYCKWFGPRSWLARWVWLALRNVASLRDVLAGADVLQRPAVLAESHSDAGNLTLMWDGGNLYQMVLDAPLFLGLRWRANVGYKLGIVANRPEPLTASRGEQIGTARASAICTWFAIKGGE